MKTNRHKLKLVPGHQKSRKLIVNPKFQLQFLGAIGIIGIFVIAGIYTMDQYFLWKFWKLASDLRLSSHHLVSQFLRYQENTMHRLFLELSGFIVLVLSVIGFALSHKIASPLYRLTLHLLSDKENSNRTHIQFSKNDLFQEVANAYNQEESIKNTYNKDTIDHSNNKKIA